MTASLQAPSAKLLSWWSSKDASMAAQPAQEDDDAQERWQTLCASSIHVLLVGAVTSSCFSHHQSLQPAMNVKLANCRLQQRQRDGEKYAKENAALIHGKWRRKLRLLKTEELKRSLGVTQELYRNELARQQQRIQVLKSFVLSFRTSLLCQTCWVNTRRCDWNQRSPSLARCFTPTGDAQRHPELRGALPAGVFIARTRPAHARQPAAHAHGRRAAAVRAAAG